MASQPRYKYLVFNSYNRSVHLCCSRDEMDELIELHSKRPLHSGRDKFSFYTCKIEGIVDFSTHPDYIIKRREVDE